MAARTTLEGRALSRPTVPFFVATRARRSVPLHDAAGTKSPLDSRLRGNDGCCCSARRTYGSDGTDGAASGGHGGPPLLLTRASPAIPQVQERKDGVAQEHSRAGVAHDGADTFPHGGFVAMNRAVGAGGFVRAEAASVGARDGVIEQLRAFRAEGTGGCVMSAAVHPDHRADCAFFAVETAERSRHGTGVIPVRSLLRRTTRTTRKDYSVPRSPSRQRG